MPNTFLKISLLLMALASPWSPLSPATLQLFVLCFVSLLWYVLTWKISLFLKHIPHAQSIKINVLSNVNAAHFHKYGGRCRNTTNLKQSIRCPSFTFFHLSYKPFCLVLFSFHPNHPLNLINFIQGNNFYVFYCFLSY